MTVVIAVPGNETQRSAARAALGTAVDPARGAAVPRWRDLRSHRRRPRGPRRRARRQPVPRAGRALPDGRVPRGDRARSRRAQRRARRAVPRVHAPGRPVQDRRGRHVALLRRSSCRASSTGWSRSIRTCIASTRSTASTRSRRRSRARRRRSRRGSQPRSSIRFWSAPMPRACSGCRRSPSGCGAPFVILEKTRRGDRDVSISRRTRAMERPHAGADRRHRLDRQDDDRGDAPAARRRQRARRCASRSTRCSPTPSTTSSSRRVRAASSRATRSRTRRIGSAWAIRSQKRRSATSIASASGACGASARSRWPRAPRSRA